MVWRIDVATTAERQLSKLGRSDAKRIVTYLRDRVAPDPRRLGRALAGAKLGGLWRYRVGDFRVICDLQDDRLVVLVVQVGHRREVYRR